MAIRIDYTPYYELGRLAIQAGQAAARQRQQELQLRAIMQARELRQRAELAQMQLQAQEDLARFKVAMNAEAQKEAYRWQLEKMRRASELDFARQEQRLQNDFLLAEQKRLREQAELEQKKKIIMESDLLTEDEKKRALIQLTTGVRLPQPKTIDPLEQYMAALLESEYQELTPTPPAEPGEAPPAETPPLLRKRKRDPLGIR